MMRSSTSTSITSTSSSKEEKLFLNSLSSDYTKLGYKTHLDKYLKIVGYTNGVQDLLSKTRQVLDEKTGEHMDNAFAGIRQVYYIPFSKSTVDDIIKNSVRTDKSNIRFVVKFAPEDSTEGMYVAMG